MASNRTMKFGLMVEPPGGSFNSWLHPTTPADASVNFRAARYLVELAEKAHFTFAFVADQPSTDPMARPHYLNRFEPISLLSALSSVTSHIGLVATLSTAYSAPYTVARQVGSLDVLSAGRAGWNVVTAAQAGSAANYGDKSLLEHDERYVQAEEFLNVVRGLWDTWEDDAFPRDRATRTFADFSKMHVLDHHGKYYDVKGPLNIMRSPQGQPVIFQAGSSGTGRDFAARHASGIFAREYDYESARRYCQDLKDRAQAHGRARNDIQVFMGAQMVVGRSLMEAEDKYEKILNYTNDAEALKWLGHFYNHHDFSKYDLDAPFPDIADLGTNFFRGLTTKFEEEAKRLGLSLRQLAQRVATLKEDFFGTPEQVVDAMEAWFSGGAADGFLLSGWVQPEGLEDFVTLIVPELRRRGLYHEGYAGTTLRENLGIPFVPNRYAQQRAMAMSA